MIWIPADPADSNCSFLRHQRDLRETKKEFAGNKNKKICVIFGSILRTSISQMTAYGNGR